jgi:nucleotide-binding universal stress UspA family protein
MIPSVIPIPLPEGLDVPLPRFVRAEQRFNADTVADVDAAVAAEFARFGHVDLSGKSVAVAIGSRGIRSQPPVVHAVVRELKNAGALPFLVPAMGSHGGGNAEGQQKILEDYGLGADDLGIPLKSSLEVVELDRVWDDMPVYCDKHAMEADFIVPINRVKPHTSFRGPVESGLCKMLCIGLGKHTGAVAMHRRGMAIFGDILPVAAPAILAKTNVLFGVAIVENGYEKLHTVELVSPDDFVARDTELLKLSKSLIPQILVDDIDILIVDEIGKNISGAGMDPNVTGRNSSRSKDFGGPNIHQIIVSGLTEGTHGNATGVGTADITTQALVRAMDWTKTYVNLVTAGVPAGASLPLVANSTREATFIAMRSCPMITAEKARIVRIENTLDLGEIWISEAMAADAEAHGDMSVLGAPFDPAFDDAGELPAFH